MSLKIRFAKRLRSLADKLDPQEKTEKRHHPALKNPGELKPIDQPGSVTELHNPGLSRQPRIWLPGEWGGPYV